MTKITVIPMGVSFDAEGSILESALKANITLNHSCKTGSCGSCKATVVSGDVDTKDPYSILTVQEVNNRIILTCCSHVESDCQIKADYFPELDGISQKTVPAKISSIHFPTDDVAVIKFRFPPTVQFQYLAGQYLNLNFAGISRSYSIANDYVLGNGVELHIRKVSDGAMSEQVFSQMVENTLVRLDGPIGSFFVRKSDRPIIFLAGGTGFAPVKAMVESLISSGNERPIYIYWGAVSQSGLYSELPKRWASDYKNITYVPVLSGENISWQERIGFVHQAVVEDFSCMQGFDVYACGSPLMIEAARKEFTEKGLPCDQFYSDAFVASTN